jgi:retinol dehydrogenase 12
MSPTADHAMKGKVCLVTGATSGIGRVTARVLAERGAEVIVVGRSATKTRETAEEIRQLTGRPVSTMLADLSSLEETRRLAAEVRAGFPKLDVLINNAGNLFTSRAITAEGHERTWALNHLSPLLLSLELLPLLKAAAPSRIINVNSDAHAFGTIDLTEKKENARFRGLKAYANAKLANMMATFALARRLEGSGVTVNCLHPGFVSTGIGQEMHGALRFLQNVVLEPFRLSAQKGALTTLHLACADELAGVSGGYFVKCKIARPASRAAREVEAQERLWRASMEVLGME